MVRNVVTPASTSVRTVVPRLERRKKRSSTVAPLETENAQRETRPPSHLRNAGRYRPAGGLVKRARRSGRPGRALANLLIWRASTAWMEGIPTAEVQKMQSSATQENLGVESALPPHDAVVLI